MLEIEHILKLVQAGDLDIQEAQLQLKAHLTSSGDGEGELGFATLDLNREKRTGFPEVIFGEGKTVEQIIAIMSKLMQHTERVLAARVDAVKAEAVVAALPGVTYHSTARALTWFKKPILHVYGGILLWFAPEPRSSCGRRSRYYRRMHGLPCGTYL